MKSNRTLRGIEHNIAIEDESNLTKESWQIYEDTMNEIRKIKKVLEENNIDTRKIAYHPADILVVGMERTYLIEEVMGIKVLSLISIDPSN